MTYSISDACVDVKDLSCVEECPVDCIYEGARRLYIQPYECIDCGACEPVCPVDAITAQGYGGPDGNVEVAQNLEFFNEALPGRESALGSPGAAADIGALDVDTPRVMELPAA
jgi:NAD-dependent dihydropyrimidine dehydrogenase PreA subunit